MTFLLIGAPSCLGTAGAGRTDLVKASSEVVLNLLSHGFAGLRLAGESQPATVLEFIAELLTFFKFAGRSEMSLGMVEVV